MSDRDRGERRRRVVDAGRRTTEHSSGDRQAIIIPRGMGLWRPKKDGAYRVEIIPYELGARAKAFSKNYAEPGDLYYERTYFVHTGVGVNNDIYTCPAKTFNKPCPICEERSRLQKGKQDKETEETIRALYPKERQLYLLVDCDEEEKGVQLWEVSYHNFGKQLDEKVQRADDEDRERYNRFADPEEGSTLKLDAVEESMGRTKYLEFSVDKMQSRKRPLDPEWLEHGVCLDEVVREPSYEELKKAFFAVPDEDGDDRRESRRPASRADDNDDPPPRRKAAESRDDDPPPRRREPEPEKKKAPDIRVNDTVSFEYRDQQLTGVVVKVDAERGTAHIEVEGRERPAIMDLADLKLAGTTGATAKKPAPRDEEPEPPPRKRPAADDNDDPPPRRRAEPEAEEAPPKRRAAADDNDDPPPRRREPAAEPAPAKRASSSEWDDDRPFKKDEKGNDEPPPRRSAPADDNDDPPPRRRK